MQCGGRVPSKGLCVWGSVSRCDRRPEGQVVLTILGSGACVKELLSLSPEKVGNTESV